MKKGSYISNIKLSDKIYLYYNAMNNTYLFVNKNKFSAYQTKQPEEIKQFDIDFYNLLEKHKFIINDNINECSIVEFKRAQLKFDTNQYNIVINTTLECNLDCWYCYESKKEGSMITSKILEAIKKNIVQKYDLQPYKELKISFFGGEPLKNFEAIKEILIFCKEFTEVKKLSLLVDFTTNATLISKAMLIFLKDFRCMFQITLDGDPAKHNQIRFIKKNHKGTYKLIVKNIYRIQEYIPNARVWIRINFDDKTLKNISEILNDISQLDRKRNFIILRKVWQVPIETIGKELILDTLQAIYNEGFIVDYYSIPRGDICFAERLNEVLINYDGKIFKCSTLEAFDEKHTEGTLDIESGNIQWKMSEIAQNMIQRSPDKCLRCKLYPACLGPCNHKIKAGDDFNCMVYDTGLSMEEFIFYNFKQEELQKRIFTQ